VGIADCGVEFSRYERDRVTIGNGQLILHLLPGLVTGLLVLAPTNVQAWRWLCASALIMLALVKPNVAAPFFWLAMFVPRKPWPAVVVFAGYIALTAAALTFQPLPWNRLLTAWSEQVQAGSTRWAGTLGYGNLHSWFAVTGWESWNTPASLLLLLALGVWTFWYRRVDSWILLGVAGVVARLWTYHGIYDDVLIVLPIVALFRIAYRRSAVTQHKIVAGILLTATVAGMLCPARLLLLPPPVGWVFTGGHAVLWLGLLLFLGLEARREKTCLPLP
jgi:hypothetical protein